VLRHWGRMSGQGAVEAGALGVVEVACCSHLVQMVLVVVMRIVLVETPTLVVVTPLEV
jgi:hypothetical protein